MEFGIGKTLHSSAESGDGMVGRGVVHLQSRHGEVAAFPCTVESTLGRCHVCRAERAECGIHHIAHAAVVGVGTVGVIDLDCNDAYRDCAFTDTHGVLGHERVGHHGIIVGIIRINRRHHYLVSLVDRLLEIKAVILYRTFGRGGTLTAPLHVGGLERPPRHCRVEVEQRARELGRGVDVRIEGIECGLRCHYDIVRDAFRLE